VFGLGQPRYGAGPLITAGAEAVCGVAIRTCANCVRACVCVCVSCVYLMLSTNRDCIAVVGLADRNASKDEVSDWYELVHFPNSMLASLVRVSQQTLL